MPSIELPTTLSDDRVVLRALIEADIAPYVAAFAEDPELGRLLGVETDPDEQALRQRLERLPVLTADGHFAELAISRADGGFLGSLVLHSFDWRNRRAEVGFWVVPTARREGIVRAALKLAIGWMFDGLELERIEMTTTPDNQAVAALAAALGFTREGVMRARNLERGRRVDVVMFGLLRDER